MHQVVLYQLIYLSGDVNLDAAFITGFDFLDPLLLSLMYDLLKVMDHGIHAVFVESVSQRLSSTLPNIVSFRKDERIAKQAFENAHDM